LPLQSLCGLGNISRLADGQSHDRQSRIAQVGQCEVIEDEAVGKIETGGGVQLANFLRS
jgi:hypothetical protein